MGKKMVGKLGDKKMYNFISLLNFRIIFFVERKKAAEMSGNYKINEVEFLYGYSIPLQSYCNSIVIFDSSLMLNIANDCNIAIA